MVREADLHEVKASFNEIRNFDIKGELERTIDADGSLRSTFASNPLEPTVATTTATSVEEIAVSEPAVTEIAPPEETPAPCVPRAPAFVPPNLVLPTRPDGAVDQDAPAFIPPNVVAERRTRDH
jgi:sec-independent protein translocase protein TatB